jgi:hypothetical protein
MAQGKYTHGGTKRRLNPASGCIRQLTCETRHVYESMRTNRSAEKCQRWALKMSFRQWNTATFEEALEWTCPTMMRNVRTNTPPCQPRHMPTVRPEVPHLVTQILTQGIILFRWSPQSVQGDKHMGSDNSKQETLTAILWNRSWIKVMGFRRISKQGEQTSGHAAASDDVGRGRVRTGQSGSGHFHVLHVLSE